MEDYRGEDIYPIAVPQWLEQEPGVWTREWALRLVAPIPSDALDRCELSRAGIDVTASVAEDGRTMRLRTTTSRNPYSDHVFFHAAYEMLEKVDAEIGRIETIQGQPRDAWQPFRRSR